MLKADLWYMIPLMRHYILFDCWLTRQDVVVVAGKSAKGNYTFCIMLSKHYIHTFILQSIIPILFILSPKPLVLYRLEPIPASQAKDKHTFRFNLLSLIYLSHTPLDCGGTRPSEGTHANMETTCELLLAKLGFELKIFLLQGNNAILLNHHVTLPHRSEPKYETNNTV